MKLHLAVSAIALSLSFAFSGTLAAEDACWPVFHGPDGTNKSPDTGLLKEWPEGGPRLVWQAEGIGEGYSSVTIAGGMIFTAGNISDRTMITALDAEGKIAWQAENGTAWMRDHPGTRGTPTIDGDRLYHESPEGNVVCLNAKTGQKIWSLNILERFEGENIRWALAESPIVDGDRLICSPFGEKASVVALDKMTGETVWAAESTGDQAGYGTPLLTEYGGIRMILTMNQRALVGVNADNGDLLFRYPHETRYDVNVLIPIFHEGQVFISSGYGAGSAMIRLAVEGKKVRAEPLWTSTDLDNHHGGVVLVDGYLYGTSMRGNWVSLDWETGTTMYSERGIGKGSVTYADGLLYGYSERRTVGLIKPTPEKYEEISQFDIPDQGKGPTWAHPVVCGGRLHLRHDNFLYVYDVKANP